MEENKEKRYQKLVKELEVMTDGEENRISVLANTAALLHNTMDYYFWTGFYLVEGSELALGPFQGPVACYRIRKGRGVCGAAWQEEKTQVVTDVEQFSGHIACSSLSRSEIVVPIYNRNHEVAAVLDVDSTELGSFDAVDQKYLEQVAAILSQFM